MNQDGYQPRTNHQSPPPASAGQVDPPRRNRRMVLRIFYFLLLVMSVSGGILVGLTFAYMVDLPEVEGLEDYQPSVVTEILADNGTPIGQFYVERRKLVSPREIPKHFHNAVIAIEDKHFYSHFGVDLGQVLKSALANLMAGRVVRGFSTITMQLSKQLYLTPEISVSRKIKEMILATQIEKNYSKESIFTMYANKIPFAHGNYGVASAAEFYFNKPLIELDLAECAMLAAIIRTPERYSPFNNPERAMTRRNLVLRVMHQEGYISKEEMKAAMEKPVPTVRPEKDSTFAAYYVETVRQYLQQQYSSKQIFSQGLRVYTTLNRDLQAAAERSLQEGLRIYDKRRGWRNELENVLQEDATTDLATYPHPDWKKRFRVGQVITGLVMAAEADTAVVRIGDYQADLDRDSIKWTKKRRVTDLLKRGDLAHFRISALDEKEKSMTVELEQYPEVQGAFLAVENKTGAILAMVGGYDWERNKFNCATQARRQTGSIFKPFVYLTALLQGMSLDDTLLDEPFTIVLSNNEEYAPRNFKGKYRGEITMREALAKSINVPTVRLGMQVGIPNIIHVARKFGIESTIYPYPSTALGASEISLMEMVSAFSVFPNEGLRVEPFFIRRIEDIYGNVLEEHTPVIHEVIPTETAHQMITVMREVVSYGTSVRAKSLKAHVAGKTGTDNDYTNAWFIGYTPSITAGVWAGYLQEKTLGDDETGARLALPIWIDFMKTYLEDHPDETFPEDTDPTFVPPRRDDEEEGEETAPEIPLHRKRKIIEEDILPC
ncbi:MAG: PBP1A family penicillin-binding protein [Acidobacteria bacterium]|nr:PBP1A family penicillin-binding protein [Acidobacteriota bacterium]